MHCTPSEGWGVLFTKKRKAAHPGAAFFLTRARIPSGQPTNNVLYFIKRRGQNKVPYFQWNVRRYGFTGKT